MSFARLAATESSDTPPAWLQVWLEAGREGQVFTYANPAQLPLGCGDLVRLRLRGRSTHYW